MARYGRDIVLLIAAFLVLPALSCLAASPQPAAQPAKPVIVVAPNQLSFSAKAGENSRFDQLINVVNEGGGILDWVASDSSPWIMLQKGDGNTGSQTCCIKMTVDATGLVAGEYNGVVTISAASAVNSPVYLPVRLSVQPAAGSASSPGPSSQAATSSGQPNSTAVIWKNQTDLYRYADSNSLIVSGSITNTDTLWYMQNVSIVSKSGQSASIAQTIPPGETVLYSRFIPAYQLEDVKLKYDWSRP